MTIKQELIAVMERIAAEWNTPAVTVIICCEGTPQTATLYGSISRRGKCTVMTVISTPEIILGIMDYAFSKSNDNEGIHNRE